MLQRILRIEARRQQSLATGRRCHAPAYCAQRRAHYLREPGSRVVKAVLLQGDQGPVLALTAATRPLQLEACRQVLQAQYVRLATTEEIRQEFPETEVGVVPAFGRLACLPVLMDAGLLTEPYLLLPGNRQTLDYVLTPQAYVALEQPRVADLTTLPTAAEGESSHRSIMFTVAVSAGTIRAGSSDGSN